MKKVLLRMYKNSPFKVDRLKFYTIKCGTIKPSVFQKLNLWFFNIGFHCVLVYRFGKAARHIYDKNKIIGFIPIIIHLFLRNFVKIIHHVDIHMASEIGPGFFIMHYYSIIIGPVKIGNNFTIHHNVTIGERIANLDHGVPEIGDNVWIGPNSVISGAIKIGNGSTISAGCVISKDIPNHCLVAGNPGRIINNNYDNSAILTFNFAG